MDCATPARREHVIRRVPLLGITTNSSGACVAQQARNLVMDLGDRVATFPFLIRDRNTQFTSAFDAMFASEVIRILRTPVRAPRANGIAKRWVGTARPEILDRILITNRRHLECVLAEYVAHFNHHRHQSRDQRAPNDGHQPAAIPVPQTIRRRRVLGGMTNKYYPAA